MTQKIPHSLVTISQIPHPGRLRGTELVGRDSVNKLWQVFFTSHQASKEENHQRLENLFWRIWSSDALLDKVNFKELDRLITRINMLTEPLCPDSIEIPKASAQRIPLAQSTSEPINQNPKALHPILKKPNTVPGETYPKSTRLLLEKPDGQMVTLGPSNSPPATMDPQQKESPTGRQAPPKPRAHFTAPRTAGKGGRRRPLFSRRKSSQASVSKSPQQYDKEDAESSTKQENNPDLPEGPEAPHLVVLNPADSFDPFFDAEDGVNADIVPPQQPLSQPSSFGTSLTDVDIDPLTVKLSVSIPSAPTNVLAPAEPTLVSSRPTDSKSSAAATVLSLSAKEDPLLSSGVETVSPDINTQHSTNPPTETQDPSSSDPKDRPAPLTEVHAGTDVPGFPGAKRVPMPASMMNNLIRILTEPIPDEFPTCGPTQSLDHIRTDGTMVHDEHPHITSPSQSEEPKTLVEPGFRGDFLRFVEDVNNEHARGAQESDLRFAALDAALEDIDLNDFGGERHSLPFKSSQSRMRIMHEHRMEAFSFIEEVQEVERAGHDDASIEKMNCKMHK